MMVEDLQAALASKEMENKRDLENEKVNVEAMKKQMREYIKKHSQSSMDKDMTVVKLEKEVETLKRVRGKFYDSRLIVLTTGH